MKERKDKRENIIQLEMATNYYNIWNITFSESDRLLWMHFIIQLMLVHAYYSLLLL